MDGSATGFFYSPKSQHERRNDYETTEHSSWETVLSWELDTVKVIDPTKIVANYAAILTPDLKWPNFHDAEVIDIHFWRGDVRPEDDHYIFPKIITQLELCALEHPFKATFEFKDCLAVSLCGFNHQNPIMDLKFRLEERGKMNNGEPMTPYIVVEFEPCWEFSLTFKCFAAKIIKVEGQYVDRPSTHFP